MMRLRFIAPFVAAIAVASAPVLAGASSENNLNSKALEGPDGKGAYSGDPGQNTGPGTPSGGGTPTTQEPNPGKTGAQSGSKDAGGADGTPNAATSKPNTGSQTK